MREANRRGEKLEGEWRQPRTEPPQRFSCCGEIGVGMGLDGGFAASPSAIE